MKPVMIFRLNPETDCLDAGLAITVEYLIMLDSFKF